MKITTFASPRDALQTLAARQGLALATLSRLIERPDRYLSRFVREGHPLKLRRGERLRLADYLGTDVRDLGGDEEDLAQIRARALSRRPRRQPEWWQAGGRALPPAHRQQGAAKQRSIRPDRAGRSYSA